MHISQDQISLLDSDAGVVAYLNCCFVGLYFTDWIEFFHLLARFHGP